MFYRNYHFRRILQNHINCQATATVSSVDPKWVDTPRVQPIFSWYAHFSLFKHTGHGISDKAVIEVGGPKSEAAPFHPRLVTLSTFYTPQSGSRHPPSHMISWL